jgi:hypothetical protein
MPRPPSDEHRGHMQPTHVIEAEAEMAYRRTRIAQQFRHQGGRDRVHSGRGLSNRVGRHWFARSTSTD